MKYYLKLSFTFLLAFVFMTSCSDSSSNDDVLEKVIDDISDDDDNDDDDSTSDEDIDITGLLALFDGTGLFYEISGEFVIFTTIDVPNHGSPYWDQSNELFEAYNGTNADFNLNPNSIEEQNIVFTIPLKPVAADTNEPTRLGPIGISRNGVVFFNQYAGPNHQPLTAEVNSFDQGAGHPTGTDTYHYHVEPLFLTTTFGSDAFLGLLADGFPVYGPVENNQAVTNDDLDDFHGHTSATAEFPNGIYHYHITDADPYLNGNGYYGTPGNISQ